MDANDICKQIEERLSKARMELSLACAQYHPESMEVKQAEVKKALLEKELEHFRAHWNDVA
jgi:hypothetical protein